MKRMQLFKRGISLQTHKSRPLTQSNQPPSVRSDNRNSAVQGDARPNSIDKQPVAVPELGWLWRAGKDATASSSVADLRQDHIRPKKSLGQNFVTDDGILENIVKASGVKPGDFVLEIGPGTGNLTRHLLAAGAKVTAIEKDNVLYARLLETFGERSEELHVIHGDVMTVNLPKVVEEMTRQARAVATPPTESGTASTPSTSGQDSDNDSSSSGITSTSGAAVSEAVAAPTASGRGVKVVANLPYNITKEFLKVLLPLGTIVSELHIMIQEEVARRLVTRSPGGSDYRAMNLRVMYYSRPKYRFIIPKDRYFPVPGVDGALVSFKLLPPDQRLPAPSERGFISLVNKAFGERRKMLRNNLPPMFTYNQVERGLTAAGLPTTVRAQDLNVDQFVTLHCHLYRLAQDDAAAKLAAEGEAQGEAGSIAAAVVGDGMEVEDTAKL